MNLKLGDVQETALIPLSVRALETQRKNPRIQDKKAVEIIKALGIDPAQYDKFKSHEGIVARTIIIDHEVKALLKKSPYSVCVNIGCGFDNRFSRVDNGIAKWYNTDLSDSIQVRKRVYAETDREKMLSGNVLEYGWAENIPKADNNIVVAEGLFMYFSKEEIKKILLILTDSFPSGYLVVELMHPLMAKNSKHHDTVKNTNATFGWGTKTGSELEELCPKIKLIKETSLNTVMKKYTIRGKFIATIAKNLNNRIAVFKW